MKKFKNKITYDKTTFILIINFFIILHLFYIFNRGIEFIISQLTVDDSYYYFQTAWNFKHLGITTFDTINRTNGVQFLWYWILVFISIFCLNKDIFLISIIVFNIFIQASNLCLIWRIGILIKNFKFALILSICWISLTYDFFLLGMENTIHTMIIYIIILRFIKLVKNPDLIENDYYVILIFLILNVWTRYEWIILSGIFFAFLLIKKTQNELKNGIKVHRTLFLSFTIICLGISTQFIGFYLMGGSLIPINAIIKLNITQVNSLGDYIWNMIYILTPFRGTLRFLTRSFSKDYSQIFRIILFFLIIGVGVYYILKYRSIKKKRLSKYKEIFQIIVLLWISVFIYALIISYKYHRDYRWYLGPNIVLWGFILTLILNQSFERIKQIIQNEKIRKEITLNISLKFINLIFMIICLSTIPYYIQLNYSTYKSPFLKNENSIESNLYLTRYKAALWIRENVPEEDILGSWNAGQLGYFSNRKVINLDGLINNIEYYNQVLKNESPFTSDCFLNYIEEKNITWLVDYNFQGFNPQKNGFILIIEYPATDLITIQVWSKNYIFIDYYMGDFSST